jgi:excisionase family DNA binding protein
MAVIINKRLLDAKAAAEYLSISRSKLYQWTDAGKVVSLKIDGRRLFDVLDLDEFIERLKTEASVQEIKRKS